MPKYMTNLHSLSIIPPVRKLHTRILATLNGISSGTPPESISRIKWLRLPAIIPIRKAFSIPFVLPITPVSCHGTDILSQFPRQNAGKQPDSSLTAMDYQLHYRQSVTDLAVDIVDIRE